MQRNFSLPHINISKSERKAHSESNSLLQSPATLQRKHLMGIKSLTQLETTVSDSKSARSQYSPLKGIKQQSNSDSKLPPLMQLKSVQEMQQQIQNQDHQLNQQIKKQQDEVTTILLEDNQLIIQPKFFEKKGSMCTTELWSGSIKKEFLVFSQQDILKNSNNKKRLKVKRVPKNNRKGNMTEVEKLLANVYRPDKMKNQAEMNRILEDLKQGVSITKQTIDQQIKNYENRTPLDIKVRILQKKRTLVFDEENEDLVDETGNHQLQTESDEQGSRGSSQKSLVLPPQIQKHNNSSQIKVEYEILEVEDERLESSPIHKQLNENPQYPDDAVDSIKYTEEHEKNDTLGSFDQESERVVESFKPKITSTNSSPQKKQKSQLIKIRPVNDNDRLMAKIRSYCPDGKKKRNSSMSQLINQNQSRQFNNSSNNQNDVSERNDKSFNRSRLKLNASDKDIFSLNNIPYFSNDNSFNEDDQDSEGKNQITNSSNPYNQLNYDQILKSSKNPELNAYVSTIRNVIEDCNQSLEQNTVLTKQIKQHTYKLNNRRTNMSSLANLEKRIVSSTVF